jgi:NAD+ diphosphatase
MGYDSTGETNAYWFVFQQDQLLLIQQDDQFKLLTASLLSILNIPLLRQYSLGIFNNQHCICAEIDKNTTLSDSIKTIPLRKAFEILGEEWFVAVSKAASIIKWDTNHQFCGRCGKATTYNAKLFERSCTACGLSFYPRISPSIIVLIKKGDEVLMSRSPHFLPGVYALIAGFVEVGESIENAVHREVQEEVGIQIKNLCYFGSQFWPFPDSLMIAFTAEYAGGELVIDHHEIEDAGWYKYDNLPGRPSSNISIAKKLLDHFIAEKIAR